MMFWAGMKSKEDSEEKTDSDISSVESYEQ